MIKQYLEQLKKELELPKPFDSPIPGTWTIPLDEDLDIFLTELQPEGLSLKCTLGSIPKENEEAFFEHVMLSNLFGDGTSGAIIGIDENEKNIVISQHVDYDIPYQEFKDILEDFLNSCDVWKDEILEHQQHNKQK